MSIADQSPEMKSLAETGITPEPDYDLSTIKSEPDGLQPEREPQENPDLNPPDGVQGLEKNEPKPEGEIETEDFDEYISQYGDEIPEGIKSIEDLIEIAKKSKSGKSDSATEEKLQKVDAFLKARGIAGGVDDVFKDNIPIPISRDGDQAPTFRSVSAKYDKLIKDGLISDDPAARVLLESVEEAQQANNDMFLQVMIQMASQLQKVTGETASIGDFRRNADFQKFHSDNQGKVYPKTELDNILKKFPDMNYQEAQAYSESKDLKRRIQFLEDFKAAEARKDDKKKRYAGRFANITNTGKDKITGQSWRNFVKSDGTFDFGPAYDALPQDKKDAFYKAWRAQAEK